MALTIALTILAQAEPPRPPDVVSALESALADSIERAAPSVVAIVREKSDSGETTAVRGENPAAAADDLPFQGRMNVGLAQPDPVALPGDFGSGVVIGPKGEILTVYHLVKGAARVRVRAAEAQEFDAEILAADPRTDLAVIVPRESASPPRLRPIAIGDASKLRPGAFLLALGNVYNTARDGRASASWGILSNTSRRMEKWGDDFTKQARVEAESFRFRATLLQLDARLNLGMSGGAVVNLRGELVGVTTAAGGPAGFDLQAGYAIPMDALGRRAAETLRDGKEVEYAFLGISLTTTPNVVGRMMAGTPAAQARLAEGDLIVEINGVPVAGEDGLSLTLSNAPVGRPVPVRVVRGGEKVSTVVTLSKYPVATGQVIATNRPAPWRGLRVDFTSVLGGGVTSEDLLTAMSKGAVGVVSVAPDSAGEKAGLRRGQIITAVEGRPVRSPSAFQEAVAGLSGPVSLQTTDGPVTVK